MDYAKSYFGKSLDDLTYQDVEGFFEEAKEESVRVEFKAYATGRGEKFKDKLSGVIKGLCALLNSEGGILIWGAPEGQKVAGKKEDIFKGALSPVDELREKDRLINTILDTITPLPTGISVKILDNNNSEYVYIFEVQVSNYRPHQYKHTYWARLDGQTRPAPHYLVEALMRRITYPNIEAYLKITDRKVTNDYYAINIEIIVCNFSELQNEENVILDVTVGPGTFFRREGPIIPTEEKLYSDSRHRLRATNFAEIIHFGMPAVHFDTIGIPRGELSGNEELSIGPNEMIVMIHFGGKHSPMKSSEYIINVARSVTDYDYNTLILSKEENVTMADGQRNLGKGKADFLKTYLGR